MKWFFCLDEDKQTFDLCKVAVTSCRANTELSPICLYCGSNPSQVEWLADLGVQVIQHKAPVLAEIEKYHPTEIGWRSMYLRLDIPLICEDEFCLYADVDTKFVGDCEGLNGLKPKYLAGAPQEDPHNLDFFNNGIMLLNCGGMRKTYDRFVDFTRKKLAEDRYFDQFAYNDFYAKKFSPLPIEYNWKSYWSEDRAEWGTGVSNRTMPIQIIHYHGPKPWNKLGDVSWWAKWPDEYFNEHHARRAADWFEAFQAI